jgi:ubiquinone/menaquinone biosynthesis C-methylase UbiE
VADAGGPRPSRGFFDLWSRVYDASLVQRAIYRPVQDAVLAELRREPPERVLDIGCGTGILTAAIRAELPGTEVVGCDFSAGMLRQAAERAPELPWVQGDALRLPLPDATVDAVTSTESFHWFPDSDVALHELGRILRPGGRLLVAVVHPWTGGVARAVATGSRVLGQPGRWMTKPQMADAVERAGFDLASQERVRRIGSVAIPTILTVARRRS